MKAKQNQNNNIITYSVPRLRPWNKRGGNCPILLKDKSLTNKSKEKCSLRFQVSRYIQASIGRMLLCTHRLYTFVSPEKTPGQKVENPMLRSESGSGQVLGSQFEERHSIPLTTVKVHRPHVTCLIEHLWILLVLCLFQVCAHFHMHLWITYFQTTLHLIWFFWKLTEDWAEAPEHVKSNSASTSNTL